MVKPYLGLARFRFYVSGATRPESAVLMPESRRPCRRDRSEQGFDSPKPGWLARSLDVLVVARRHVLETKSSKQSTLWYDNEFIFLIIKKSPQVGQRMIDRSIGNHSPSLPSVIVLGRDTLAWQNVWVLFDAPFAVAGPRHPRASPRDRSIDRSFGDGDDGGDAR